MTVPHAQGWRDPFSSVGKQVLRDGLHYADACGECEAELIVAAMNRQTILIESVADRLMEVRS